MTVFICHWVYYNKLLYQLESPSYERLNVLPFFHLSKVSPLTYSSKNLTKSLFHSEKS